MPRLVINPGTPGAFEVELKPGANFIGRGFANDIKVIDGSVSGSHCQITVRDDLVTLKDLGSTNGTFVDRALVHEAELKDGQTVHLGSVEMCFYAGSHASPGGSAPLARELRAAIPSPQGIPVPTAIPLGASAAPVAPQLQVRVTATPGIGQRTTVSLPLSPSGIAVPGGATSAPEAPEQTTMLRPTVLPPVPLPVRTVPPPVPTVPPPAPPIPGTAPGSGQCKFHPKTPGRFYCPKCHGYFCELCINSRPIGAVQHKFCRQCAVECMPVKLQVRQLIPVQKSFFARLPGAFAYPVRGSGVFVLMLAAIIFAALNMFSAGSGPGYLIPRSFAWWWWLKVFAIGYLFTYMQNVIHSTALEDTELPSLPRATDFWQDILLPFLQLLGICLICFGPAILVEAYMIMSGNTAVYMVLLPVLVLGVLYFPMAFLAVAMLDSVAAANPLQVVPSILKVPLEYLVAVLLLGTVLGLRYLGDFLLPVIFPRGLSTHSMPKLFAYLGAQAFWSIAGVYLLTVGMHILGLVYVSKKEKLGWLDH